MRSTAFLAVAAVVFHVAHVLLGVPVEGVEQVIVAYATSK